MGSLFAIVAAGLAGCADDTRATVTSLAAPPTSPSASPVPPTTARQSTDPAPSSTPTLAVPAGPLPVPTSVDAVGFDDHTVPRLDSLAELMALSRLGAHGQAVVKFTIPDLEHGAVRWMDSNFYALHDEWYWFRLLNGQPAPGVATTPVTGHDFATVDAIRRWAAENGSTPLPLDLRWVDGRTSDRRLYSPEFYRLALHTEPRTYGIGSLVRMPGLAAGDPAHWLIELEYADHPTVADIALFFERIAPTLPTEVASRLEWVIRSPEQATLAQEMVAAGLAYSDRIVHYRDLVPKGQTAVYSEGIAAGRLLFVGDGGAELGDALATDIVIVDDVPDWLPPASALISSAPQTPLAHVNLLARNRGIPNASQAGVSDDPAIRQASRVRAPAIVRASGVDGLEVVLITEAQYRQWQARGAKGRLAVPAVDTTTMPYTIDLDSLADTIRSEADVERWRPVIGGKSAGFLTLLATDVVAPPDPVAITVRPYLEHLALVRRELDAMLANSEFRGSARARLLLLEGLDNYVAVFPGAADGTYAEQFIAAHPVGTPLGDVLDAGGFIAFFRAEPMNQATLTTITATLRSTFGDYDVTEGLRFRSSSSVEDIEGFSGAGLYESNTGFLEPERQLDEGDHKRSVEHALKKTWSSYWRYEAFEERRLENVDHLSGAMGVTVHARSDDILELNNGVATFTILPPGGPDSAVVLVNVVPGAASVTNPDPIAGDLPEVIEVVRRADGTFRARRLARSTLAADHDVFADSAVAELFAALDSVATLWRDQANASLPAGRRSATVVLDFEFKTVAAGWPILPSGQRPYPARLVVRQVRSLDPGLRGIPGEVRALYIPRDVLARARLVERVECTDVAGRVSVTVQVFTDPLVAPDLGYSAVPFMVGAGASHAPTDGCTHSVLFSTPEQVLVDLLATSSALDLDG